MSTTLQNSIWPNAGGTLGENKVAIPDGVTVKWPDGDALIGNFVYKNGKLVGFVDTKALITNETKSTIIPYDCVNINLENILEDTLTIIPGKRCKSLTTVYGDVVKFLTPKLKELLGETKFELYFENNAKKLIIHTDRISDDMVTNLENLLGEVLPQTIEMEKYNHHIEVSWRDINKYAECETAEDMLAVNPDYCNDVTSDGWWVYPTPKLKTLGSIRGEAITHLYIYSESNKITKWSENALPNAKTVILHVPNVTSIEYCFIRSMNLVSARLEVPSATTISYALFQSSKVESIEGDCSLASKIVSFAYSCPKLQQCELLFPKASDMLYAFSSTMLNKKSALRILNSIPAYTSGNHPLTIGIHIDNKYDPEVNLALKKADINYIPTVELTEEVTEGKGWTLTVQWNGTPTSTTTTLNLGTLIYAKAGEMEQPDGTTEKYLDWGHYVTNWEERGYEQFRSLESAYEYFGLEMNN